MKNIIFIYIILLITATNYLIGLNGKGTKEDPYQITNIIELQNIKTQNSSVNVYYILMNDIDASETRNWNIGDHDGDIRTPDEPMGFKPIYPFDGSLDGNGYVILNLYINRPKQITNKYVALFGQFQGGGEIKRVGLENCDITGSGIVSGFCAAAEGVIIKECFVTGTVKAIDSNTHHSIAGFCWGRNFSDIYNCYSSCTVTCLSTKEYTNVLSFGEGTFETYRTKTCYSTGKVVSKIIATVFGEYEYAYQSFWDVETTGIPDTGGHRAKGLPTSEMKKKATYVNAGWDFVNVWCIDEGKDYPKLRAFGKCPNTDVPQEPKENGNKIEVKPNPASTSIDVVFKLQSAVVRFSSYNNNKLLRTAGI